MDAVRFTQINARLTKTLLEYRQAFEVADHLAKITGEIDPGDLDVRFAIQSAEQELAAARQRYSEALAEFINFTP